MTTFEEAQEVVKHWRDDFDNRHSVNSELTLEDYGIIADYVRGKFSPEEKTILHIFSSFEQEFARGHRCMVCGRTKAQNEAIGYDCLREC